jgi:uncharacterized phiE125 gp8 family phage protein
MWYPATVTVAAASEPVSLDEAREQCRVAPDDSGFDSELTSSIKASRAYVEACTGTPLVSRTIAIKGDCFSDLAKLPLAPVQSVTSIAYTDSAGDAATLSTDVYELRAEGLCASIVLKYNQSWPAIQSGSRITVTAVVGYVTIPEDVMHAMKLLIGHWFSVREAVNVGNIVAEVPFGVDNLLANHRIWAF